MKTLAALAAVAALSLGMVGTADAGAAPSASRSTQHVARDSARAGYTPPALHWHSCSDARLQAANAQCAMLTVPMDYAHPSGTKIKIALSRVKHTASHYQGVMLVNPGGPGGSGLGLSTLGSAVPNHAGDAYDWIGFDPRGVGASQPSLSCNRTFFHGDRPPYKPTSKKILRAWVTRSKRYAADCAKIKHSALFRHVKTTDNVADMESIRKALGQSQINYYGFSYGTYLGQVYATLHPHQVRRMVLDSNVDPRQVFYKSNLAQDVAFQKTFNIYFDWIAKYHTVFHLGNTHRAVRARYLATVAALNRHAARGFLGGDEFTDVVLDAGYYVYDWVDIADAWAKLVHKHNAGPLIAMYKDANPTTKGGDNGYAIYLGTQCTDAAWPRSQKKLDRDSRRLNRKYDYETWDNAWFNGPCAYWKFPHSRPVHVADRGVSGHILLIDETYDPATPYEGSLYIRRVFPNSSLIEGKNGTTHAGSLSGVSCTDNSIARYLSNGTVPRRLPGNRSDKVCPPVPKPDPTVSDNSLQARSAGTPVTQAIRAAVLGRS
ncbi:alpha/beta hydrolase [uncultured Jatrophihabitans sp.]|uniref:alpha/beta hydrolase n=1 Tax=uncultured Jatrophihabitans sp. TaxID=1610747 RepID=UPI0035CBD055